MTDPSPGRHRQHLAAVLFADIAGYSSLSARDHEAAQRLVGAIQSTARTSAEGHEGRIVRRLPGKAVHLLVVDGFADWEPAHAVAELRRHGGYGVETVGLTSAAVESMGGLRVLPTKTVSEVDPARVAVFILPGGDRWETSPVEPDLDALLNRLDADQVPIAAICGATVAIARLGLLHGRRHTSNGLEYLRSQVPDYCDAASYMDAPAVRDRGLITASGLADVEFARELFEELNVLSAEDRAAWATIFRSGRLPERA